MKIKIYYNNNSNVEEMELKNFIENFYETCKISYSNAKASKKDIEYLKVKVKHAYKNIDKTILLDDDFAIFLYYTIISSDEVQGMVVNNQLLEKDWDLAETKCVKTLEVLKKLSNEAINKNLQKEAKGIWLRKQIDECNSVGELFKTLNRWYNSLSLVSKNQAAYILCCYCFYMLELKFFSEEYLNKNIKLKSIIKKTLSNINKNEKIDSALVEEILKLNISINVDIKKTLNQDVITNYNNEILVLRANQEQKIRQVLEEREKEKTNAVSTENNSFKEAKIELTEEDMVCLQLYLEIVTDLSSGKIKIEDFENKTANYISYVEGTHYKEILEELVIKIQNSTDISKNIKTKGIKAINALKRTI